MLRALHASWEAVDLDDALLRASSALKLALLLEEMAAQVGELRGGMGLIDSGHIHTRMAYLAILGWVWPWVGSHPDLHTAKHSRGHGGRGTGA